MIAAAWLTSEEANHYELEEVLRAHGIKTPRLDCTYEQDAQLHGVGCTPSASCYRFIPRCCHLHTMSEQSVQ